ncbi:MAG: PKD domain-containing protein [Candidatus Bipolaricaulia bacterium]
MRMKLWRALLLAGLVLLVVLALVGCRALFNKAPVAVIEAEPRSGPAPLYVNFDGSASYDRDGRIVRFAWDFGDNSQTGGERALHIYRVPGEYRATLTVIDDLGARGKAEVGLTVLEPSGHYRPVKTWGSWGAGEGELGHPRGIDIDPQGRVFIADTGNDRIVLFTGEGEFIEDWGRRGSRPGEFVAPQGIAIKDEGVYVLDSGNRRVQRLSFTGRPLGEWAIAEAQDPYAIAVAPDGTVYVADRGAHLIYKFTPDGRLAAQGGGEGDRRGQLSKPGGVAVAADGSLYVADTGNHRIQRFTSEGIALAEWGGYGREEGQFSWPLGLAIDRDGYVYVADSQNGRVQKLAPDGTPIAVWEVAGGEQNAFPCDIAVDEAGYVYVLDFANSRVLKFGRY